MIRGGVVLRVETKIRDDVVDVSVVVDIAARDAIKPTGLFRKSRFCGGFNQFSLLVAEQSDGGPIR